MARLIPCSFAEIQPTLLKQNAEASGLLRSSRAGLPENWESWDILPQRQRQRLCVLPTVAQTTLLAVHLLLPRAIRVCPANDVTDTVEPLTGPRPPVNVLEKPEPSGKGDMICGDR